MYPHVVTTNAVVSTKSLARGKSLKWLLYPSVLICRGIKAFFKFDVGLERVGAMLGSHRLVFLRVMCTWDEAPVVLLCGLEEKATSLTIPGEFLEPMVLSLCIALGLTVQVFRLRFSRRLPWLLLGL